MDLLRQKAEFEAAERIRKGAPEVILSYQEQVEQKEERRMARAEPYGTKVT
jgi:hypothetical protein